MLSGFEQRWNQLSCTSIKGGFRLQFSSLASVHLSSITKAADITLALENKLAYLSIALVLPFLAFWCCHSCHFWALCPFGSVLWQGLTVHYPRFFTLGRYSQFLWFIESRHHLTLTNDNICSYRCNLQVVSVRHNDALRVHCTTGTQYTATSYTTTRFSGVPARPFEHVAVQCPEVFGAVLKF